MPEPTPIVLDTGALRVELDAATGAVRRIRHTALGMDLLAPPAEGPPWSLELADPDDLAGATRWTDAFTGFAWSQEEPNGPVTLRWDTDAGPRVEATVAADPDTGGVVFRIAAHGAPGVAVDKIGYPLLGGIADLHDIADTMLAHPQGTGFLFRRPGHLFRPEDGQRGLRHSPYPEGFNGSTMQFWALFAEGVGGFMLRTDDPDGAMKWFDVYKDDADTLRAETLHQAPDLHECSGYDVPYTVRIEPLHDGTWFEAAERYKAWAVHQPWCRRGPLADRDDRPHWLLDEVGFSTFGVNAAHDRAAWLDRFHAITDQPVFHVLGVNWPKVESGYGRGHPGGRDDWFPARFSRENVETIQRNGDRWAPFEFDLLLDEGKAESDLVTRNRLRLPEEKYSTDTYRFRFQCPATDYLPALHRWRDATLAGDYGADALYYDISANNVLMACREPEHGHPVGGGAWMVEAVREMWSATGRAASEARGAHVPQGAEMISELFIGHLDFYQARAEASPLSAFEADRFRDWIREGAAEKIPLFAFVYHEYGPVRMDGWGKLSAETGDLWYWVAARVALWGGLYQLNYEFSDLEALDGHHDDPAQHYADIERRAYAVDPGKVAFVRDLATARTGFANPWLVYGTMQRPLALAPAPVSLDYHLYNCGQRLPHYDERDTMTVDSVVHAAWRAPDGRLGFVFVDLRDGDSGRDLALSIDPAAYGADADTSWTLRRMANGNANNNDAEDDLGSGAGAIAVDLRLDPRRVTVLEVTFASG